MSFTSTYANKPPNYKGMSITVGIHAAIFAGVMALPAITAEIPFEGVIEVTHIPLPTEPPPPTKKPAKEPLVEIPQSNIIKPVKPVIDTPVFVEPTTFVRSETEAIIDFGKSGNDSKIAPILEPLPGPVIAEAALNSRYSRQFQPNYPSGQLRLGTEGMVTVRVLVGANGRAKQVELIDTPHKDFWTATKRHALRKWRFNPATRDGKPFESWITLKVQFKITD